MRGKHCSQTPSSMDVYFEFAPYYIGRGIFLASKTSSKTSEIIERFQT